MARPYRSAVRADQADATRASILAAFADQLGCPGVHELSIPSAARSAAVSVRTVYHHFPDPAQRLAAVAAWADDALGGLPAINGVDDLPDHVRRAYARAAASPAVARALAVAGTADGRRDRRLRTRHLEIAALLTGLGAPAGPTTNAVAVVAALASPEAGLPLLDVHGLSMEQAGDAAAQAVAAVIADLRARRRTDPDEG